ncbi:MAG TPA: hypothetical protein VKY85_19925 [Candidatus Angelobacter sp.]|nr:hypothetical protein [Candidatus Angelobacter sp.]
MAIPISIYICIGMAMLTIAYGIMHALELRRIESETSGDVLDRARQISEALQKLKELEGKEREASCRAIARAVRNDCDFLLDLVWQPYSDAPPKDKELERLTNEALSQIHHVYRMVNWILFLLRFRPSLVRDCRRVTEAVLRSRQMWIAYARLLRAQYPEEYGSLALEE